MERDQQVAGLDRRLIEILEERRRRNAARAFRTGDLHFGIHGQHHRGEFGGGIRQGDAAAQRAAVADRRVRDMRGGERQKRRASGDQRIVMRLDMPGQRAQPQTAILQ